jgi:glycerophosphoryl diester phosphodiesterase
MNSPRLIAHRGNINGISLNLENTKDYIDSAIKSGYDVEVDVRTGDDGELYMGHDEPQHEVELGWLCERSESLWIHCKDFKTLSLLTNPPNRNVLKLHCDLWVASRNLKVFYHEKEDYTIISNGLIWAHNLDEIDHNCVIPLLSKEDIKNIPDSKVWGICSDYVGLL